ncbi:hypothetical protein H5410_006595 [Solanum commersonii]|uniref:Uncharacterized protein n=1 Tax=Solanum commersonii TaxID=4109 RepID=A0A9J6AA76_SOLCO|nr:hypothetical protein H5410_006595 [Solanum commersonii]
MEERQDFMIEEELHQAVVFKLSHGAPDLKVLKSILLKHLGTKGNCLIDLLAPRQFLLRFDQYEDYVLVLSRSVNYDLYNGEEHQCRFFHDPLDITLRRKRHLFAKKSLQSIASTIGKPIAIDKATQSKSRPSTARVKSGYGVGQCGTSQRESKFSRAAVWCIRLQFVDGKSGKLIKVFQEIVYDNLHLYCNYCKHQGHDEDNCRLISRRNQNNKQIDDIIEVALKGTIDSEKYQDRQLVAATSEQNRADSMDVDTSNIGVQTTTENKGDCNNQQAATNEVQSKEIRLNLWSNATKNARGTPRIEVDALQVSSGKKLMDSRQKLMDTSDVEDDEISRKHVLLVENENATKNWTVSPPALNSKLSPEVPVFVPKCVLAKKNESRALGDSLDEDEEDDMLDICFDRVAREGDILPRQQRSRS